MPDRDSFLACQLSSNFKLRLICTHFCLFQEKDRRVQHTYFQVQKRKRRVQHKYERNRKKRKEGCSPNRLNLYCLFQDPMDCQVSHSIDCCVVSPFLDWKNLGLPLNAWKGMEGSKHRYRRNVTGNHSFSLLFELLS